MPRHATKTSFKPGQSGNISGKPKGARSMLVAINHRMDKIGPDGKTTCFETTADNITQRIMDGEMGWDKEYMQYLDGKPKQPVEFGASKSLISLLKDAFNIERSESDNESDTE